MAQDSERSSKQKAAEAEVERLKKGLGPFVVAAETTRMPMVFTDARDSGHPIIFANQAFLTLTGYEEHDMLGQSFDWLFERGIDPEALSEMQTAFDGGRDLETQVRYCRKDGSSLWVTIFITPVRNQGGEIVQHFASFVDVTRNKREEDQLRVLLNELDCQKKTLLAVVRQTFYGLVDQSVIDGFEAYLLEQSSRESI